jgi:hypothetical protein
MKPRTQWACQPVAFVMDYSSSLGACAAGTGLSFMDLLPDQHRVDPRQITQNNARRVRSEPSKTLTVAPIQPPFPEPRYARKARAVIDFEAPTDLTINEPSTEGPTRVFGLPIDFGRVICCVNLTSSSVNGRVSLASEGSDKFVSELHFLGLPKNELFCAMHLDWLASIGHGQSSDCAQPYLQSKGKQCVYLVCSRYVLLTTRFQGCPNSDLPDLCPSRPN